ncbi:hypothetical protein HDE_01474 [Halotydeus destructor]|nr:hypothetical protein HDE_01474 [Halotydeus destructor]
MLPTNLLIVLIINCLSCETFNQQLVLTDDVIKQLSLNQVREQLKKTTAIFGKPVDNECLDPIVRDESRLLVNLLLKQLRHLLGEHTLAQRWRHEQPETPAIRVQMLSQLRKNSSHVTLTR